MRNTKYQTFVIPIKHRSYLVGPESSKNSDKGSTSWWAGTTQFEGGERGSATPPPTDMCKLARITCTKQQGMC